MRTFCTVPLASADATVRDICRHTRQTALPAVKVFDNQRKEYHLNIKLQIEGKIDALLLMDCFTHQEKCFYENKTIDVQLVINTQVILQYWKSSKKADLT